MKLSAQRDMNNRSIPLHDAEGFDGMRRAGRLAAETLDFIGPHVRAGITTVTEIERVNKSHRLSRGEREDI